VNLAMDFGLGTAVVVAFGAGWVTRLTFEPKPVEKPCSCACTCRCEESSNPGFWLLGGILLVVIAVVGFLVFHVFYPKVNPPSSVGSPKGRKGVYGISGKVLSLTG